MGNQRFGLAAAAVVMTIVTGGQAVFAGDKSTSESGAAATPVKLITFVGETDLPSFAGQVAAGESALLAFRVAGQMETLHVKMGETVVAGQVLAELDDTDYRLNLEARQAEYDLALVRAQRAEALIERQLVSEDQFDTTQAELATAAARLERAKEQLSFCKLEAPFSGSVAFRYNRASEVVAAHQSVINLQDTSSLDVNFNLPDQWQHLLSDDAQMEFYVTFDLLPDVSIAAVMKEVNLRPDSDTNSHQVTLNLKSPENFSGRSGMSAQVQLDHPSLTAGNWLLPADAIIQRDGQNADVWRFQEADTALEKITVTLDAEGAVIGGLDPGDRIVVAGVKNLTEGQIVRPWVREGGL